VTSDDQRINALLDKHVPLRLDEHPQWEDVLRRARVGASSSLLPRIAGVAGSLPERVRLSGRPTRLRVSLGLAIGIATLAIPIVAVGATRGWWFSTGRAPEPVGATVIVTSGTWNNIPWTLTAYRSKKDGVCYSLTPRGSENTTGAAAAMACTNVVGLPQAPSAPAPTAIGFLNGHPGNGLPDYVAGPVSSDTADVEIKLDSGQVIQTPTVAPPSDFGAPIRFYVTALPCGVHVREVVARDGAAHELERRTIPSFGRSYSVTGCG